MDPAHTIELVKAVAGLVGVLVWPAVVVFVLVRFGPGLRDFFGSLSELTFKAAGVEAIAKRRQAEVAAALGAAAAQGRRDADGDDGSALQAPREIADSVASRVTPQAVRRFEEARVLWVDDVPSNNVYPRRALEALGVRFDLSTDTDDALEMTKERHYDAIISDMGRPPDARAGYTLLDALRRRGDETPFLIFSSDGGRPQYRQEARRRGAQGSTHNAQELFEMVVSALVGS